MSSSLVKVVRCDVCDQPEAVEYVAVRAGGEPADIDLCSTHREPLDVLERFLEQYGRRRVTTKGTRTKGKATGISFAADPDLIAAARTCPTCGQVCRTRQALSTHSTVKHQMPLKQLMGTEHLTCPECGYAGSFIGLTVHARDSGHSLAEPALAS